MKIQLLLTGNELMAGHTIDSNSALIAEQLAVEGYHIQRKVTIGDDYDLLVGEIKNLAASSDVVIINGGLGPTVDDLTAQALSEACDQPLEENPQAIDHLQRWCGKIQLPLNEANRKQAILPAGVEIIDNPSGSAVGFMLTMDGCAVICTPGVPSELRVMLEQSIVPLIKRRHPVDNRPITLRWQTFGIGESTLQQRLSDDYPDWPEHIELGFRAGAPLVEIKLSADQQQQQELQRWADKLTSILGHHIIGTDDTSLAEAVLSQLEKRGQTVTTAESCTGGLIASTLTRIAGASKSFEAGFVTYSNTIKQQLLAVDHSLLERDGAVSENVARAMAHGALKRSKANWVMAVTGIAGPEGGSEEKPVGTVWIAWGNSEQLHCQKLQLGNRSRKWFQNLVSAIALDLLRRQLLGQQSLPGYLKRWQ